MVRKDQAPQWGKKEKNGFFLNRKNIGERSKPSGGLRGQMATEPGDVPLMLPFHDTRFWHHALIGQMSSCCRFVVLLTVSRSLRSYNSGKYLLKHGFRASNTNFIARLFSYPSAPRRAKNMPVISVAKRKRSIQ